MNNTRVLQTVLRFFRSRRMRLFERTFRISSRTRILDVGGSPQIWELASVKPQLTILNLPGGIEPSELQIVNVIGDGRLLPFPDEAFDIVFSNSVIEHVGTHADQRRFANEIARVGRSYWVQTPNRRFPIELHLMLPLIHFLPKRWQRPIVNRFTLWERLARPSADARAFYLEHFLNDLNLLDAARLKTFFPDGMLIAERVLGMPKSLIAFRKAREFEVA